MEELKKYLDLRIADLKKADATFCDDRWDLSKSPLERFAAREASNEVTARRNELESVLRFLNTIN